MFRKNPVKVEGSYERSEKQQVTRATIGKGDLNILDQEKQNELETSGKTGKLAAINRDVDATQEVTKDEHKSVKFYASSNAIADTLDVAEKAFSYIDELVKTGKITSEQAKEDKKLEEAFRKGKVKFVCSEKQGWLHDLIFTPAYAGDGCVVKYLGASALYDEKGVRISQERVDAINKEAADKILKEVNSLMANIEVARAKDPEGKGDYLKGLESRFDEQIKYLALCTSDAEFSSFMNSYAAF